VLEMPEYTGFLCQSADESQIRLLVLHDVLSWMVCFLKTRLELAPSVSNAFQINLLDDLGKGHALKDPAPASLRQKLKGRYQMQFYMYPVSLIVYSCMPDDSGERTHRFASREVDPAFTSQEIVYGYRQTPSRLYYARRNAVEPLAECDALDLPWRLIVARNVEPKRDSVRRKRLLIVGCVIHL